MFIRPLIQEAKLTRFFTVIILGAIIASFSFAIQVNANPITVLVSPTSGSHGTNIEVQGSDCTPDGEVRIYFGTFIGFFAAATHANTTGQYFLNITVPVFPAGTYSIIARDMTTGDENSAPFTIRPKITLDSDEAACGDEVTVKGYGFRSEMPLTIEFDGIDVTPWLIPRTDGFGSFKAKFNVPVVPKGRYNVNLSDGTHHILASIIVNPKITLNPTSGSPASVVVVNGTGFLPLSHISVTIGAEPINVTMYPTLKTNSDGSFQQIFFVPDLPDGEYIVNATDITGNSAITRFFIPSPILTLKPSEVFGSAIVTAEGKGFPPNQQVLLYLETNIMVELIDLMTGSQRLYADEYGEYRYSFFVPVTKPGFYQVIAYNVASHGYMPGEVLASASLKIIEDALIKGIKDDIATIIVPDLGIIKENLTSIKAELIDLEGNIVTINSTIGLIQTDISNLRLNISKIEGDIVTIQTTLGTLQGRIESIEGDTATIETEIGTITADLSNVKGTQESFNIPLYINLALVLIAVLGTIYLTIIHVQAMRRPVG
jgi:hypothetical protein